MEKWEYGSNKCNPHCSAKSVKSAILHSVKVLIFGPSGAGKTHVSSYLKQQGINAVDADTIPDLSNWYFGDKKVIQPENMDANFLENHSFVWDREFLKKYLEKNDDIYLFGSSGNVFDVLDLFDKVFFLHIDPIIQRNRLTHKSRLNPMGKTSYQRDNAISWGEALEREAKELGLIVLDANVSSEELFQQIKK